MDNAKMQEAMQMMIKAISMMEAAMDLSAESEDTTSSTGQLSNI